MTSFYEIHIYKDGDYEIFDINIGSGHGEDVIYMVRDTVKEMETYISFKYVLFNRSGNKYIKFNIPLNEFTECISSPDIVFQNIKNIYIKDKSFEPCIPTVYSNEYFNLLSNYKDKNFKLSNKISDEIFNILKQIKL